jgi:hypothetical protein
MYYLVLKKMQITIPVVNTSYLSELLRLEKLKIIADNVEQMDLLYTVGGSRSGLTILAN